MRQPERSKLVRARARRSAIPPAPKAPQRLSCHANRATPWSTELSASTECLCPLHRRSGVRLLAFPVVSRTIFDAPQFAISSAQVFRARLQWPWSDTALIASIVGMRLPTRTCCAREGSSCRTFVVASVAQPQFRYRRSAASENSHVSRVGSMSGCPSGGKSP